MNTTISILVVETVHDPIETEAEVLHVPFWHNGTWWIVVLQGFEQRGLHGRQVVCGIHCSFAEHHDLVVDVLQTAAEVFFEQLGGPDEKVQRLLVLEFGSTLVREVLCWYCQSLLLGLNRLLHTNHGSAGLLVAS